MDDTDRALRDARRRGAYERRVAGIRKAASRKKRYGLSKGKPTVGAEDHQNAVKLIAMAERDSTKRTMREAEAIFLQWRREAT